MSSRVRIQQEKGRIFVKAALLIRAITVNILPCLAGVVRQVIWHASHDFAVLVVPFLLFDVLDA